MCCDDQCLFFISVRTGSLIFGYILAVISGLGTISCAGLNMYLGAILLVRGNRYEAAILISSGFLIEFLSSFVCSVLMIIGINKNKPHLVKTFLIYGLINIVLVAVFMIMVNSVTSFTMLFGYIILALSLIGTYAACLTMVFKVYKDMSKDSVLLNPPPPTNPGVVYSA